MTIDHAPFVIAAWLFLWGLYGIVTSRHLVHLTMCLAILQTSTYLLLVGVGYRAGGIAPILVPGTHAHETVVDPVVHALMLTDVVVEATVMALVLALAVQVHEKLGTADPSEMRVMRG
jgi:multicomponent Na+:H+ antiporter subunit C